MKNTDRRTYYLVDYENTGPSGLNGAEKLSKKDRVLIFCSQSNGAKISSDFLSKFNHLHLKVFSVPQKKQSVDMHIMSYLGYLVGKKNGSRFVIVSKDSDYDDVMKFWKDNKGAVIGRQQAISCKAVQLAANDSPRKNKSPEKKVAVAKEAKLLTKTEFNCKIQKALSKAKIDGKIIGEVSRAASKQYTNANRKVLLKGVLKQRYGKSDGTNIYNIIEDIL